MKAAPAFSGIIPPLVTPLTKEGSLDRATLEALLEHELAGGVSGIFVLGTTGEGPHLEPELRQEIVMRVCRHVAGRVPVVVGLCDPCTASCVRLAEFSAAVGASAVVLTPPFYMPLSQDELLSYLQRTAPRLALPVFLYNIPALTKIRFAPETVKRAVASLPIVGLKDSSGDLAYFAEMRAALPRATGFRLFCGPEEVLLESLALGGDGGVCGGANLFPHLYVSLFKRARDGQQNEAAALQRRVLELSAGVYARTPDSTSYLRGLKAAMSALGLCQEHLAEPLRPLPDSHRRAIGDFMRMFRSTLGAEIAASPQAS